MVGVRRILVALLSLLTLSVTRISGATEISWQGYLTDSSGAPITAAIARIEIGIWDALEGGNRIYFEEHANVLPDQGLLSLRIGQGVPLEGSPPLTADLFASQARYLELTIDTGVAETLAPRRRISSVGYALRGAVADTVEGVHTVRDLNDDGSVSGNDIQLAILAAATQGGGIVFVPPGNYLVEQKIELFDNVELRGAGRSTVLEWDGCMTGSSDRCSIIRNVFWDNTAGNTGLRVRDLTLVGGENGVILRHVSDVVLEDLWIEGPAKAGIVVDNTYLGGANFDLTIQNNHIRDTGANDGITVVGAYGKILGNTVKGAFNHGIHLHTDGANSDWIIANNLVEDTLDHCIDVTHATRVIVTGNRVRYCGGNGAGHGIALDNNASGVAGRNLSVTSNIVADTAANGIKVSGASEIRDVNITANIVTRSGMSAIHVGGGRNLTVTGNVLSEVGFEGIDLAEISHSTISSNSMRRIGNSCDASRACAAADQCSGIKLRDSLYVGISGNRISHDLNSPPGMSYGICVMDSTYVLLSGNLGMGAEPNGTFPLLYADGASQSTLRAPACSNLGNGDDPDACP